MTSIAISEIRTVIEELVFQQGVEGVQLSDLQESAQAEINTELGKAIKCNSSTSTLTDGIISASIAAVTPTETIAHAQGLINPTESQEQASINTLYDLASLSKFIVMVMAMRLVHSGLLSLDAKLGAYLQLDEIREAGDISIRDLIGHKSGLKDKGFIRLNSDESFAKILSEQRSGKPGEHFFYANTNYVLLTRVIEKLLGLPMQQCFDKLIGTPLSLSNTYTAETSGNRTLARGYKYNPTTKQMQDDSDFEIYGATNFRSCPTEVAIIAKHLFEDSAFISTKLRDEILSAIQDELFVLELKDKNYKDNIRYGMGVEEYSVDIDYDHSVKLYGHSGWQDSHAGFIAYCPETKTAFCLCVSKTQGIENLNSISLENNSIFKPKPDKHHENERTDQTNMARYN